MGSYEIEVLGFSKTVYKQQVRMFNSGAECIYYRFKGKKCIHVMSLEKLMNISDNLSDTKNLFEDEYNNLGVIGLLDCSKKDLYNKIRDDMVALDIKTCAKLKLLGKRVTLDERITLDLKEFAKNNNWSNVAYIENGYMNSDRNILLSELDCFTDIPYIIIAERYRGKLHLRDELPKVIKDIRWLAQVGMFDTVCTNYDDVVLSNRNNRLLLGSNLFSGSVKRIYTDNRGTYWFIYNLFGQLKMVRVNTDEEVITTDWADYESKQNWTKIERYMKKFGGKIIFKM